jgi:hypothetical protein
VRSAASANANKTKKKNKQQNHDRWKVETQGDGVTITNGFGHITTAYIVQRRLAREKARAGGQAEVIARTSGRHVLAKVARRA